MLADVVDRFVEYVSRDGEARAVLDTRVVQPALEAVMRFVNERLRWCVWVFQAVALLVLLQTCILLWLLFRECKR